MLRQHTERIRGQYVFIATTGSDSEYLHMVAVLATGNIRSIATLYFNGAPVRLAENGDAIGRFKGLVHVEKLLPTAEYSDDLFPGLIADQTGWCAKYFWPGWAQAYVRLRWNERLFRIGIPTVHFTVAGIIGETTERFHPLVPYQVESSQPRSDRHGESTE